MCQHFKKSIVLETRNCWNLYSHSHSPQKLEGDAEVFAKDEVLFHLDGLGAGVFVFLEQSLQNLDLCHGSLIIFPVTQQRHTGLNLKSSSQTAATVLCFQLSLLKMKPYLVNQIQIIKNSI